VAEQILRWEDDDIVAEAVPGVGGRLNRVRGFGVDLLRTPPTAAVHREDPFFWGAYPLAPWCNRATTDPFVVAGRRVELPVNFPDGSAIHGEVYGARWDALDASTLGIEAGGGGWPWRYEVRARFSDARSDRRSHLLGCGSKSATGALIMRLLLPLSLSGPDRSLRWDWMVIEHEITAAATHQVATIGQDRPALSLRLAALQAHQHFRIVGVVDLQATAEGRVLDLVFVDEDGGRTQIGQIAVSLRQRRVDLLHQAPLDREVTKRRTFDEHDDPGRLASGAPIVSHILSRVLAQIDSDITEAVRVIQCGTHIVK
jgi:Aldose 1-epimerase